jgi:hypothetical protein
MENDDNNQEKEYKVPPKFKPILIDLIKEILINQPEDIISFCAEHFKIKQEENQINLNRVTTYPILSTNIKNGNSNNKLCAFQKKFVSQKSNVKKELVEENNKLQNQNDNGFLLKDNNIALLKENSEEFYIFDCINFDEKEKVLSELKLADKSHPLKLQAEKYYNNNFIPNKKHNDLLILAQKLIFSFYENKGTNKENEFINLEKNFNKQIAELKNEFLLKELGNMEILDALNIFKKQNYYMKMLKCYLIRINLLKQNKFENNELIDEMCYFIFLQELKSVSKFKGVLDKQEEQKKNTFFNNYFNINIKLLIPEIYSFAHSIKFLDEDSIICNFSDFSIRKRDLCLNYFQQIILQNNKTKELSNILTELQMKMYISTPEQVIKALDAAEMKTENKEDEIEPIEEKIKKNNPNLSLFINKLTNTPYDSLDNNINEFMGLKNIEREIVLKLLKLSTDFSDIYNKFNNIKINQKESEFCSSMKKVYFNLVNIKELNFMYNYIFKNEIFTIPDKVKNFIEEIKKINNKNFQEEKLIKEYQSYNFLCQIGLYLYLLLIKESKPFLESFINKLNFVKLKYESIMHRTHIETLLINFTHQSDEANVFKLKYLKWKEELPKNLVNILEKESFEEKEKMISNINNDVQQKIIFNIFVIESLINKDKNMKNFVDKLRTKFPLIDEIKKENKESIDNL